jgi:hypothetical protein
MSWQAAEWALNDAPFPKSDPAGRLVLAYLAAKADKHGRNAYPLALSIAHALDLNPEVVPRVLKRLCGYGLISKDGMGPQGQPKWSLHMDKRRAPESFEEFCDRQRGNRSARQSRWREKVNVDDPQSSTGDDSQSSTEDDRESSTRHPVDDPESSRRRSSVVSKTIESRHVDDRESPHISPYNGPNGPYNGPLSSAAPPSEPADALPLPVPEPAPEPAETTKPKGYTTAFEDAWIAYGRKGAKKTAFSEWQRAIKTTNSKTIAAAIRPYVASTPELKYRKDFERWLKGECWESAVIGQRAAAPTGGHQTYRDPVDLSVYDEKL